jgi:hypothetical protein
VFRLLCSEAQTLSRWLQFSLSETNAYVVANPLCSGRRNRIKENIDTVCRRHLDFDIGKVDLNSLRASDTVRTPTGILSTSLGKYQIFWRVIDLTFTRQGSTPKLRTMVLGSYFDCTGWSRTLHLRGLRNTSSIWRIHLPSNTTAIQCGIPLAVVWIFKRRTPCFRLAQSQCGSVSVSSRIPHTVGVWILHALAHVNDVAEFWPKEPVAGGESTGSMQVLKARSRIQFRAGARTVLRTGRIVTLHPCEGTVGKPACAIGKPS